jgi:anthranilate phosphoribosyltransferase
MMIRQALSKVLDGSDLACAEAAGAMEEIMTGEASAPVVSAYLAALRTKGETTSEILGSARVMQERALPADLGELRALDLCGTGGDGKGTFNISTTCAFVAAAAGVPVAKHGNRAASSKSGSADVLEALGARVSLGPEAALRCIREVGIGFLYAPAFHPAMKAVAPVRRELGVRTIFNLLGPLVNPARVKAQLLGVFDPGLLVPFAEVLKGLGVERACVVHGEGGYDEATTAGSCFVATLQDGEVQRFRLDPKGFGFPIARPGALDGGDAEENAKITLSVLEGEKGPRRDTVVLNAALALYAAGAPADLDGALEAAERALDSGKAREKLGAFAAFTQRLGEEGL